ncbi:atherin-like [Ursus americanus]|uniref:atherin-like n=1 Tax=Ursus americanus TaxID=9643 RepID=UPI001E67DBCC|nr:atherin-like [Ursus americanus]
MLRRRLLLLAGPLRLRGEPPSRGAAEGGGDAGRLCKVWEEDEASGRPGGVRGLAGLSGGGRERGLGAAPRPGPAYTKAPSLEPPAKPALGRARDVARPRGFPALSSPAPRGDGLRGAGAAAWSRGARRRRRRLALRLGPAPTARARLSLRAGTRGPAALAAGAGSRAPRGRPAQPRARPPPPPARPEDARPHSCEEMASPNFVGGHSRHLGLAVRDLKEERRIRENFVSGSWRVLGRRVEIHIPRLRVRGLDTCLLNAPTSSFKDFTREETATRNLIQERRLGRSGEKTGPDLDVSIQEKDSQCDCTLDWVTDSHPSVGLCDLRRPRFSSNPTKGTLEVRAIIFNQVRHRAYFDVS